MARQFHACTHTTFTPNIVHGGSKINTIPDTVDLEVDIRTLPGQTAEDVEAQLREAIGDLTTTSVHRVRRTTRRRASPIDTPLWDSSTRAPARFYEGSHTSRCSSSARPTPASSGASARRPTASGCSAATCPFEDYATMFHGDDERVDQESLRLSTELWEVVARDLLD